MTDLKRHKSGDRKKVFGSWPMGLPETNGTSNPGTFRITEQQAERLDNRDPEKLGQNLVEGFAIYKKRTDYKDGGTPGLGMPKTFSQWIDWSGADREIPR